MISQSFESRFSGMENSKRYVVIHSVREPAKIICVLDLQVLHRFILNHISQEFTNMVENCYYPKIAKIYNDLLHMCSADEKELLKYADDKYGGITLSDARIAHDPYNTLLILIIQEFLSVQDYSAAETTFHLFSLRSYTNTLYKRTTPRGASGHHAHLCLPDIFQSALDSLSKNHMFVKKRTIAASIIHYSNAVFVRYKQDLIEDNSAQIFKMIYEIKSRINQSLSSFFEKYYAIYKAKDSNETKDDEVYDQSHETKLKDFVSMISNDICVYKKRNNAAVITASQITKFNKKLSIKYSEAIAQPKLADDVRLALYLLLKDQKSFDIIKTNELFDLVKSLMAIKSTKQQIYFKKVIANIQNIIIKDLNIEDWYHHLSVQSVATSKNYIAYYLAIFLRSYI